MIRPAVERTGGSRPAPGTPCVDTTLLAAALVLVGLGLVMVASASITIASRNLGSPLYYFWKQLAVFLVAAAVSYALVRPGVRAWQRAGAGLLVLGIVLLALVLVPGVGREVNGSARWLALGPVSLQPSELMKLFLVVYLAGYLVRRGEEVRRVVRGFFKPVAVMVVIATLLLLEPDYGATVVLFVTALGMLFLGGVPLPTFLGWGVLGAAGLGALAVAAPYRLERLTTFLNPWADPYDSGFQLTQALIAVGRGEWLGVGLGGSVQKLFYLPEAHTDFLFAVIGEELGFAGMALVIVLFAVVVARAFAIAAAAERRGHLFAAYLAYGLGITIGLQAFVNIGVNLGVLPTKGLPLPLMSHGANSLLVHCVAVALLLRIDHETRVLGDVGGDVGGDGGDDAPARPGWWR